MDLIVELAPESLHRLGELLPADFRINPQTLFETVTFTVRNLVTIKDAGFKIELFHLKDDEYDQDRFRRRTKEALVDCVEYVATAEDVIIQKLRWLRQADREKDRNDVKGVVGRMKDSLD